MTAIIFDTEFTHLWEPHGEPAELISIGCVSETGQTFYAENAEANLELCSDFTREAVLPLLDGGDHQMTFVDIATRLKAWIESMPGETVMWTDAPGFDWPLVQDLLEVSGWPENLRRHPAHLAFADGIRALRFENAVEAEHRKGLRRHHALDDAKALVAGWARWVAQ